eukprot:m.174460 g.174460  ORF g.174460 m.174460 type:complete len:112 (-) comp18329_c0_seq5:4357-4692(-)
MSDTNRVIEVPVRQENNDGTEQIVLLELDLEEQAPEDIISIFTDEKANLSLWYTVALYFYRKGDTDSFRSTLEAVEKILDTVPDDSTVIILMCFLCLVIRRESTMMVHTKM